MSFKHIDRTRPVLIVDDSSMYRTAAKGMLQKLGYQPEMLHFAQDASEAISRCRTNQYGLVLFDYNLGEKANGFQLIDELQTRGLLAADCANIIVTGDATAEVVRGFMELNPDGYLLKPLNYTTLKDRLPGFIRKKHILGDLLVTFSKGKYEEAINLIDETFYKEEDIIALSQRIKAESMMALGQLDEARNVLINLQGSSENGKVTLNLAQIALNQRQYKQGLFLLKPLQKDPFHAAAAAALSAELHVAQISFEQARDEIERSISISPKVIQRHRLKVFLNMALFDLPNAIASTKSMILESRHSFRESLEMYQLGAQLVLDQAQFSPREKRLTYLSTLSKWAENWRAKFPRQQYKHLELLIFARGNILKSDVMKGRALLADYYESIKRIEDYQPTLLENVELSRVYLLLGKHDEYQKLTELINIELKKEPFTTEDKALLAYLSQWRNKVQRMRESSAKLKQDALQLIEQKNFEKASSLLARAMDTQYTDMDIPKLLLGVLTRAWPHNWSKRDVLHLAIRCKDQLHDSPFIQSKEFIAQSRLLAQQLDYAELAAPVEAYP
ncbi:response regulator [Vibrio sp. T187]|uniref:response regulator n=1 Tax=Vibrio TaxID=662 RepID=UPI0010C9F3A1|nr:MULTISPECIES: response regulator [Vibrio]MBW3698096.1 response regulator [Vibrio sp. T187]